MGGHNEPVAIIGSGCRFPGGCSSPSKLWDFLCKPSDVSSDIPIERFNPNGFFHANGNHHGTSNVKRAYFLQEDPCEFDAKFFNINNREAEAIDPQQRILLETVYESIERAGYPLGSLQGTETGVFVGLMCGDYYDILMRDIDTIPQYFCTGVSRSIISNRLSYFFDWKGPSMTIDTACSSSLVAVHQAVQALRNAECKIAIAAGVNLIFGPESYIAEAKFKMLSPTGTSKMWDASADGYARGEGCGSVVLKLLKDAILNGDHIESIIKETGVNSDGRTKGITMPSALSQKTLIQQTYRKAGLDPYKWTDRCQYFEAHGTGTLAGDPIEAEAISSAFFTAEKTLTEDESPLLVGSIKTVIGHLEGAAGIAGLLKASLAVQNRTVPSNLHFNDLNEAIRPFYGNIEVPKTTRNWPEVPSGEPLRASVNSFGFGGTNAHAILESYAPPHLRKSEDPSHSVEFPRKETILPFLFSAGSEESLVKSVGKYVTYLKSQPMCDLHDLAWTLHSHRSLLPVRISFAATSREAMIAQMESRLEEDIKTHSSLFGSRPAVTANRSDTNRILAVFTGQGAQWVGMSRELIKHSPLFARKIASLERTLQNLPIPMEWSFTAEILASPADSRLDEATISQPLCTAVQIALVDLLRLANVEFDTVVGHSSGEIAAAYASGCINAEDAIIIAYYRGLFAKLAKGYSGSPGAMMATGIGPEEALSLCSRPQFLNRLYLAACNAPKSSTLSGDAIAINEAKEILDQEGKFARVLKIGTAYHSPHMKPCSGPYLNALQQSNLRYSTARNSCTWISSVHGFEMDMSSDPVDDQYWLDNLLSPVLFLDALTQAISDHGPFDLVLEIGPHSALRGAANQTIQHLLKLTLPYYGILNRGEDDISAFASALGGVWSVMKSPAIDFKGFVAAFTSECLEKPRLLKDLPSYYWDHGPKFWKESRISRNYRTRSQPPHELLGSPIDSTSEEFRWRNILKLNEIPWLRGHKFQNEVLFPAAGYCVMALEASKVFWQSRPAKLVELLDLEIIKGISISEDSSGMEILFSITKVHPSPQDSKNPPNSVTADFICSACNVDGTSQLSTIFTGRLEVSLGEASPNTLPLGPSRLPDLLNIQANVVGLKEDVRSINYRLEARYSLSIAFLPRRIRSIRFNPIELSRQQEDTASIHAFVTLFNRPTENKLSSIIGDVDLLSGHNDKKQLQVEGLELIALSSNQKPKDRELFFQTVWIPDIFSRLTVLDQLFPDSTEDIMLINLCERISCYYYRVLRSQFTDDEIPSSHRTLFDCVDEVLSKVQSDWLVDTYDKLYPLIHQYSNNIDIALLKAVGENIGAVIRGESTMLEHMLENNMLNNYYRYGIGFPKVNSYLARVAQQISHRYPQLNILEIGAGTGGTTSVVLPTLGNAFSSYTYTDVSTGFFQHAKDEFVEFADRLKFKTLDIEHDTCSQDFGEPCFDMIIASNVLHATKRIEETLRNARGLLKPGGFFLMVEVTGETLRPGVIFGGLPGWWLGVDDGRRFKPGISMAAWDSVLRKTGFSGAVSYIHDFQDVSKHTYTLIVSQAVDSTFDLIRQPLLVAVPKAVSHTLLVVGGTTEPIASLREAFKICVQSWVGRIIIVDTIGGINEEILKSAPVVLSMTELDHPLFHSMTPKMLQNLQKLFRHAQYMLWITCGCVSASPYSNMTVGLGRTILSEEPHLKLQFLDFENMDQVSPTVLTEAFLRFLNGSSSSSRVANQLWISEPELRYEEGCFLIPRILPLQDLNNRLNSRHRSIVGNVPTRTSFPLLERSTVANVHSPAIFPNGSEHAGPSLGPDLVLQVTHSSLFAIRVAKSTYLYLCLGFISGDKSKRVLAFSPSNKPMICVPETSIVSYNIPSGNEPQALALVIGWLIGEAITRIESADDILLYSNEIALVNIVSLRLLERSRNVTIMTSTSPASNPAARVLLVHPLATRREIQKLCPSGIKVFVDLSHFNISSTGTNIGKSLPSSCRFYSASTYFKSNTSHFGPGDLDMPMEFVRSSLEQFLKKSYSQSETLSLPAITPENLESREDSNEFLTYVNWASGYLPVQLEPINPKRIFRNDRTYILIGLADPPQVGIKWKEELQTMGANVLVHGMDVADKAALLCLRTKLRAEWPPVAGLAHGAMVLSDSTFNEMNFEELERVLIPKVRGSANIDEVFRDDVLDFFIMFSSLASVIGNPRQSNYAAANMFMASLAAQRRARGAAASVIDIGMIIGVGYLRRSQNSTEENLRRKGFAVISEPEFHEIFAEAVLAGSPTSSLPFEIITGLQYSAGKEKPLWHDNPRFSHLELATEPGGAESSSKVEISLKDLLSQSQNSAQFTSIVRQAFEAHLKTVLQFGSGSISHQKSLTELGLDSLMAVEIRTWFLKELDVNFSVLKILGGASIAELCAEVISQLQLQEKSPVTILSEGSSDASSEINTVINSTSKASVGSFTTETLESNAKDAPVTDGKIALQDVEGVLRRDLQMVEPLSYGQSRLWFLMECLNDPTLYNCTVQYRINGPIDPNRLKHAFISIATRHEILRTLFFVDPGTSDISQGVLHAPRILWDHRSGIDGADITSEYSTMKNRVFDLRSGKTMAATLLSSSESCHDLIIGYHHIIMDGTSLQIVLGEIATVYTGLSSLGPVASHYVDFAKHQKDMVRTGIDQGHMSVDYLTSEFEKPPPMLPLFPFAKSKSRKALDDCRIHSVDRKLDTKLTTELRQASSKYGATPFHLYLSALQILLQLALEVEEICIGICDANRTFDHYSQTVGLLAEILPVRFVLRRGDTFDTIMKQTRSKVLTALKHGAFPYYAVLPKLEVSQESTYSPLYQVILNYIARLTKDIPLENSAMEYNASQEERHIHDLVLTIRDEPDGSTLVSLTSPQYLYDLEDVEGLMRIYIKLLDTLKDKTPLPNSIDELFEDSEREKAIERGKGPLYICNWPDTLSKRVAEVATRQPDASALKGENGICMSYTEMFSRANGIRQSLEDSGVQSGEFVAVTCEPNADTVCSLLGIWLAGAVYVPLEMSHGIERLSLIFTDCNPALLICISDSHVATVEALRTKILHLPSVSPRPVSNYSDRSEGFANAILLYTSGSTGVPKGVLLTHENLRTQFSAVQKTFNLGQEVVLQQSSMGFDASLFQIFNALANGGTLIMTSKRCEPVELADLMLREKVTLTFAVPPEYCMWVNYGLQTLKSCASWRFAFSGGEKLTTAVTESFSDLELPGLQLINGYGPTEASMSCSMKVIELSENKSQIWKNNIIGWALPNYSVYVLNENLKAQPVGWPGEICISGPGVSHGYLSRTIETGQTFSEDPFNTSSPDTNQSKGIRRLYRTGDRGQMLKDGSILFQGRLDGDTQVKLRGQRIELEEVSNHIILESDGTIREAVVILKGEEPNSFLAAFVVFSVDKIPATVDRYLRSLALSLPLPPYMRPSVILSIDQIPKGINGKTNRAMLDLISISSPGAALEEGELNHIEMHVAELWRDVLPSACRSIPIRGETEFFSLGGNSLLLVKLQSRIREFCDVKIALQKLFQSTTLKEMALQVELDANNVRKSQLLDWDTETSVADLSIELNPLSWSPNEIPKVVLLTGSTGFLGRHVLSYLLNNPNISTVHCIAVRATSIHLLPSSSKIVVHEGDLSQPALGLSMEISTKLSLEADAIIHNGAEVSLLKSYLTLRETNVQATKFLCKFAASRQIPLHYVSTAGVTRLAQLATFPEASVSNYQPSSVIEGNSHVKKDCGLKVDGYTASKWASEVILERAHKTFGIPVRIYRPTTIIGPEAPRTDIMANILESCKTLATVPLLEGWTGYFDLVRVENVASAILNGLFQGHFLPKKRRGDENQPGLLFQHLCGDHRFAVASLKDFVQGELERTKGATSVIDVHEIGLEEWISKAKATDISPVVIGFLETVDDEENKVLLPELQSILRGDGSRESRTST
ncbi:hypothetical protein G7Y89_g1216 [Cudoniella acicularis]|uniref:Uncharacterized protein n=1 Tax=Cudoniella acicularis TaxID=354080 RepID=A0A8H4RXH6_9HELO|nr:hypothetical protein G7Y89_g1216 [Cudoniella acicularis]